MNSAAPETVVTARLVDPSIGRAAEQSRARYPDEEGFVERDGQRLFYEVYGEGEETVFLLPTWSLVHSRHWKMQIAYFARHFRVLVMDGLGNGRSDRCHDPRRYRPVDFARDCLAVMDATGTERAVMMSLSTGAQYQLELARLAPERVAGAAFVGPWFPYTPSHYSLLLHPRLLRGFRSPLPVYRWWVRFNAVHWRESHQEFVQWFVSRCLPEPHSTKAIEDGVGWALDTDPQTLIASGGAFGAIHRDRRVLRELARGLDCPVLVVSRRARQDHSRRATPGRWRAWPTAASSGSKARVTSRTHASRSRSTSRCATSPRTPSVDRARRATRPSTAPMAARGRCSSPRRSGSATPSATSRSLASCAVCTPICRSTGSLRTRSRGCWRPRASDPSGQRSSGQRVQALRVGVRRARSALLPRAAPHGRDPGRQLHAVPRHRARTALRLVDR